LQPALNFLKYKKGDFPVTDSHAKKIISFPCDQHLSKKQLEYVISTVKNFYKKH
jgi:dTDP-4-amino-4,6-dideoxygalactose transaminase